jgi:AraC-like ligand binding domain
MQTTTPIATFAEFETLARARGFDAVLEREWGPNIVLDTHTHPFSAWVQVVRGEFWLSCGDQKRHLKANDQFELDAEVPHAETYGAEGATYWVARKAK